MTENKRGRPAQAPDFDRVITAINEGKYDERILEIDDALENRRDHLKAQLRERVKKVFGADADVVINSQPPKENIFVQRAQERSRDEESSLGPVLSPVLHGQYRISPDDGNMYHLENDYGNGMVSISSTGRQQPNIDIPKIEWESWGNSVDDETRVEPELNQDDVPLDQRGAIIGGMAVSDMGN